MLVDGQLLVCLLFICSGGEIIKFRFPVKYLKCCAPSYLTHTQTGKDEMESPPTPDS
jgi:hypothetical protein